MAALEAFLLGASAPSAALFLFLSSWAAIVFGMDANAGRAFPIDRQSFEPKLFTKATQTSPVSGPAQSHVAWPVRAPSLFCCDVCVRFATAKQDETLLSLPSCATIAGSARRDSRNK
jgi:hypothetical protein